MSYREDMWKNPNYYYIGVNEFLKAQFPDKPKDTYIHIWAYVEDEDDEGFWDKIFYEVISNNLFKIKWITYQGSKGLIKMIEDEELNAHKIICIDSDYRYLLDDKIIKNKFIFHTYTHSIENHFCYEENLQYYTKRVTKLEYNDDYKFNFETFLTQYSNIIYDQFICLICKCTEIADCNAINSNESQRCFYLSPIIAKLCNEFKKTKKDIDKKHNNNKSKWEKTNNYIKIFEENLEKEIIKRFSEKFKSVALCKTCNEENRKNTEEKLLRKRLTKDNAYLFIRGHTLYDKGIQSLIDLLIRMLEDIKCSRIHNEYSNNKAQLKNERNKFKNNFENYSPHNNIIPQGLNRYCAFIDNIKNDIKNFFFDTANQAIWFS